MFTAEQIQSFTHELKFVAPSSRHHVLESLLKHHLQPDPNHPIGIVSSIYFDTPRLDYLYQKVNSDYLKTKVRARWYSTASGSSGGEGVFAEAKFRIGTRRTKVRKTTAVKSSWLEQQSLTAAGLISIPSELQKEGLCLRQPLLPFMVVRYQRRRYIDPYTGIRVSLDTEISGGSINPVFNQAWSPRPLGVAIVEVKGRAWCLPHTLRHLPVLGGQRASFSKYAACFEAAAGIQL